MAVIPIPKAQAIPTQTPDKPDLPDDTIHPLVLVVTNNDSNQQRVGNYLMGVGYDVAVVSESEALLAAIRARRPYAVLIDQKMADAGNWPAGAGPSPEQPESSFADTLIRHKFRSCIPSSIPQVSFSEGENGQVVFSLLDPQGAASGRTTLRLVDAIRRSEKTAGKKLKTVLIIDDEPALLELLTLTLLQEGFKVLRAPDGRKGVELATSCHPDVIILDFTMPEFDGSKVVAQLRANPRTKDIPILIQTGTVLNDEERQRLAGHVQAITYKTEKGSLLAELERLEATGAEAVLTGANP
jgi:CheY-like chemotaxis protein